MVDKSIQEIKPWRVKGIRVVEVQSNVLIQEQMIIGEGSFKTIELHLLNDTIYQRILLLKNNEVNVIIANNIEKKGGTRLDEITIQPHTFWQKIFKKAKKEYYLYVSQEIYNTIMGVLPQPRPCTWIKDFL